MNNSSLKKNISYSIVYQLLLFIIPFITTPYISRVFGVSNVGKYSFVFSISHYFVIFGMLGLNNLGIREISSSRGNIQVLSEKFFNLYIIQFSTSLISIFLYFVFILNIDINYKSLVFAQSFYVISTMFDINWFYIGLEKMKFIVVRNALIKLLVTFSIFTFVKSANDLTLYAFILSLSTLISQLILWKYIKDYIDLKYCKVNNFIDNMKSNLILFIPVISISLYRYIGKIMITLYSNSHQTGLFESADKIIVLPLSIVTALGFVMLPRMSYLYSIGDNESAMNYIMDSIQFILAISFGLMFGLISLSKSFTILYFGIGFEDVSTLISMMSPIIVISSWANIMRTQILLPKRKDSIYVISVVIGAFLNILVNLLLVPKYGALGASISAIITEFSVALIQTFLIRSEIAFNNVLKSNLPFFFSGILMFVFLSLTNLIPIIKITFLVCQILVGIVLYFFISFSILKITNQKQYIYIMSQLNFIKRRN